eukprot:gene4357-6165_t
MYCEGRLKPFFRGRIHAFGAILLIPFALLCIHRSNKINSTVELISVTMLFLSSLLTWGSSALFHCISWTLQEEIAIQRIGHLTPETYNNVITRSISPDDIEAMKSIGYRILEFGKFNWDSIFGGLNIYYNYYGNVDIPSDYIVTEDIIRQDIGFNYTHEGMKLGEAVAGLRIGDIDGLEDLQRHAELDSLGFDWGDKSKYQRFRFVPMLLGLKVFNHLFGFPVPLCDFVVPDEPQWPYWMAGMPLGEWATAARMQQAMLQEHYPHRKDMLNALEFIWWLPPDSTFPKKYYEPLP